MLRSNFAFVSYNLSGKRSSNNVSLRKKLIIVLEAKKTPIGKTMAAG